jgi:hypothetical protein
MADDVRDLSEQLRSLGRGLSAPVPDELAERVLMDIAAAPVRRSPFWRRWTAALAALVVAIGASLALSAPVRAAIAQVFGFGGTVVQVGPGPSPAAIPLLPGEHVTDLAGAQREVGFQIRVPTELGQPDSVTVADGRVVSLHYARPGGAVRIDQFAGDPGPTWEKYVEGPALVTRVNGHQALWFDEAVTLIYIDANGVRRTESTRRTGPMLVWAVGDLTFRLDGIEPLDAALSVASSMT